MFLIILLVVVSGRIMWNIYNGLRPFTPEFIELVQIWIFGVGILSLVLFAIGVNYLIISRIKKITNATKEVIKGNYTVNIDDKSQDEIGVLTKNFNTMTAELSANEYLSKDFVKNVSHEFKTPISSIKGFADLIAGGGLTAEEINDYAKTISDEAERLYKISGYMLRLSKLDSSNLIKKEDNFSVAEQIRKIILLLQSAWEGKGLVVDADMEEIFILGNEELTFHIWHNLIDNAIKFSPTGGVIKIRLYNEGGGEKIAGEKKIELHNESGAEKTELYNNAGKAALYNEGGAQKNGLYNNAGGIRFEITNAGAGIDGADKEHIFRQFYTGEKSRNSKSTGLGLSITKKIVEKLGGEIGFDSVKGEGATFFVRLK
jgi:signal transduction histidine kinase